MSAPGSRVRITAKDRKIGMTLDELRGFVDLAERVGMDGSRPLRVVGGLKGQLKRIEVLRAP